MKLARAISQPKGLRICRRSRRSGNIRHCRRSRFASWRSRFRTWAITVTVCGFAGGSMTDKIATSILGICWMTLAGFRVITESAQLSAGRRRGCRAAKGASRGTDHAAALLYLVVAAIAACGWQCHAKQGHPCARFKGPASRPDA